MLRVVQVQQETEVPVAADLLSNVNASANHGGALKPIVPEEIKQVIDNADIIDVCGSRLNKDGYTGFDGHSDNYSSL